MCAIAVFYATGKYNIVLIAQQWRLGYLYRADSTKKDNHIWGFFRAA